MMPEVKRIQKLVEIVQAMATEDERRAAFYFLVAKFYGNAAGDKVLEVLHAAASRA